MSDEKVNKSFIYQAFLDFIGATEDSTAAKSLYILLKLALFFFAIIMFILLLISERTALGQTGDFFGGMLNPIFGFLTFMGLLVTIILQRESLKLSKDELKHTREELKKSAEALDGQLKTLEKQRIENTFFSLLEQHNKMLADLNMQKKPPQLDANAALNGTLNETVDIKFIHISVFGKTDLKKSSLKEAKNIIQTTTIAPMIKHYFISLYQILNFIASSHNNEEKFYSNIIRAYIDVRTLQLIAVNAYSEDDSFKHYKELIERYAFLEHMPFKINGQISPILKEVSEYYKEAAFDKSIYLKELRK